MSAWYVTVLGLWALGLWWLFRRDGARALVDHPGLFQFPVSRPSHVKLLACAAVLAGVAGMAMAFGRGTLMPYWTARTGGHTTVFVVYDGFWRVVAIAALFLSIGSIGLVAAIVWIRRLRIPRWWNRKEGTKPGFLLLWSVLWLLLATVGFSMNLCKSYGLLRAYRDGAAGVVEGTVHVLREQPESGHAPGDLIDVKGVRLIVDYFMLTPAYKQTIAYGGVLREGAKVRVWYYDSHVLRIDVQRS